MSLLLDDQRRFSNAPEWRRGSFFHYWRFSNHPLNYSHIITRRT